MNSTTLKFLACIQSINPKVKSLLDELNINKELLPCVEAFIVNSLVLGIAWNLRRGRSVKLNKHFTRVSNALRRGGGVSRLIDICRFYDRVLRGKYTVVADLGCGLGLNLVIVNRYLGKIVFMVGLDKDVFFLKLLKSILSDVDVIQADVSFLPIRDESLDIAFITGVIHELPDLRVMDESKRTVKAGGIIFIGDFVLRYVPSLILKFIRFLKVKLGLEPETPFTLRDIVTKIKSLSLVIEEIYVHWKFLITGKIIIVLRKP